MQLSGFIDRQEDKMVLQETASSSTTWTFVHFCFMIYDLQADLKQLQMNVEVITVMHKKKNALIIG